MDTYQQTNQAQTGFNKRTEGALEPAGTDLLAGNTAVGNTAIGTERAGGMNEVCDPPSIYNAAGAREAVNYVHDDHRERTYEPLDVNKTVVQHEIERVKPVLHQVEHRTVLHEVVHHKVAPPVDLGITEVVHHGHTDQCGKALSGLTLNDASTGIATEAYSSDATRNLTGTATTAAYGSTGTTGAYGQTEHSTQEPGGVKGLINKVVPGPGPFKATDTDSTKGVAGTERSEYGSESGTPAYAATTATTGVAPAYAGTTGPAIPVGTNDYTGTNDYAATTGPAIPVGTNEYANTTGTTGYTGTAVPVGSSDYVNTTGTTGTTGYTDTTGTAGTAGTAQTKEPHGIKALINKVIPGPGPFK